MRTSIVFTSLLTVAITACGGDPKSTTTVELDTIGPPNLVAFRLGTGDWQIVPNNGNLYRIEVDEPYVVAVACNDFEGLFDTYQFARTPDDDTALSAPCTGSGVPENGSVTGTLVQTGEVTVGFASQPVDEPNGAFDVPTTDGTHEVVAVTDTKIAVRRNIAVAGATPLATPIDVDAEGAALVPARFTIANTGADPSPFGFARLRTENDSFVILGFGRAVELLLAPDAVLGAADRQNVAIQVSDGDLTQQVFRQDVRQASDRAVTLPDALVGATLTEIGGEISASWGALPDHDTLSLSIDQTSEDFVTFYFHDLEMTKAYAEAMGTTAALDLDIPGFDSAGRIDVTKEYTRSFSAGKTRSADESAFSRLSETLNTPPIEKRGYSSSLAAAARFSIKKRSISERYLSTYTRK